MKNQESCYTILLSIIIPVYNVERYIDKCLSSIYCEESEGLPFEVIVVNDETPDNSMAIVEEYTKKYNNLYVLHQKNQRQGVARNTGLGVARGEYVWFVDSDDWIKPSSIKTLICRIAQHKEIDVFVVPAIWKYEDSARNWIDIEVYETFTMTGREYQERGFQMAAWQFVVKCSLLIDNHILFEPVILHEDGLWGFEVMYLAQKVMVMAQPLYCYRQRREGSVMHNIKIQSGYDIIKVHKLLMKFKDEYVKEEDKVWFQKTHMLRIQGATYVVWHLRHTPEFKKFLSDTRIYRHHACNECAKLGGLRWKAKCWLMKYPVLNENIRIIIKKIRACL